MSNGTKRITGPVIHAVDPWTPGNGARRTRRQLLSRDEQEQLIRIASIVRYAKGDELYAEGNIASAAYNIASGVVTVARTLGDTEYVTSFLYPGDLCGLSEEGRYSNTTRAATPVVAYRLPWPALRRILETNPNLDVDLIIKLYEELRLAQHHALLLAQKLATTRLAMFIALQEQLQFERGEPTLEVHLPMERVAIAGYLGMTSAALSRTFHLLMARRIIAARDRQHIKIIDRSTFEDLASVTNRPRQPVPKLRGPGRR